MVIITIIILLLGVIGSLFTAYEKWIKRKTESGWIFGFISCLLVFVTSLLLLIQSIQNTDNRDISSNFDKAHEERDEMKCSVDSLKNMLIDITQLPELQKTIEEQAKCLENIVTTSLDSGIVAIGLRQYMKALLLFDIALKACHNDSLKKSYVYFYKGIAYYENSDRKHALISFDSSIYACRSTPASWVNRGNILADMKCYDDAIESYNIAIEYMPNFYYAYFNRGNVQVNIGDKEKAIFSYDTAIYYNDRFIGAWINRGLTLDSIGKSNEAIESYNAALRLDPFNYTALINRGSSYSDLGEYDYALSDLLRAITICPDSDLTWSIGGAIYYAKKDLKNAKIYFKKAITLNPRSQIDLYNLAGVYLDQDSLGTALTYYDKALNINNTDKDIWFNKAITLFRMDSLNRALFALDSALLYDSTDSEIWTVRGKIVGLIGDHTGALRNLMIAIKLNNNNAKAWQSAANALYHLERYDEALMYCDSALKYDSSLSIINDLIINIKNAIKAHGIGSPKGK